MPKLDRRLRVDVDYLIIEEHPAYIRYPNAATKEQRIRRSRSAMKVWLAATDEEVYLCRKCEAYTHPQHAGPIHSHQKAHINAERQAEFEAQLHDAGRVIVAFGFLPEKIQKRLLSQADEKLRGEG